MSWTALRSQAQPPGRPDQPGPGGPPGAPPPGSMQPMMPRPAPIDSFVAERDSMMNAVLQRIAGRENAPAESVFKNIKVMKTVPAGRLVRIMNLGFGHSLGVSCRFCHIPDHWADDDKNPKLVTREMMVMVDSINTVLLPRVAHLHHPPDRPPPTVNCTTCHRGSKRPALNM
ncbi:MAG TPA: c-type cytochrome [Candidatus Udaeobacter sp.]|jgi:hypothetical protein|nr:c-type cytochrome [Candidatus Udaeobacter sp.]